MKEIEIKVIELDKVSYEGLDSELRVKLIRELIDFSTNELSSELSDELDEELFWELD